MSCITNHDCARPGQHSISAHNLPRAPVRPTCRYDQVHAQAQERHGRQLALGLHAGACEEGKACGVVWCGGGLGQAWNCTAAAVCHAMQTCVPDLVTSALPGCPPSASSSVAMSVMLACTIHACITPACITPLAVHTFSLQMFINHPLFAPALPPLLCPPFPPCPALQTMPCRPLIACLVCLACLVLTGAPGGHACHRTTPPVKSSVSSSPT